MGVRVSVTGDGAQGIVAAAAIAAAARAEGRRVVARVAVPVAREAPEHEFVAAHGALWRSELSLLEWATGRVLLLPAAPEEADLTVVVGDDEGASVRLAADEVAVMHDGAAPHLAEPLRPLGLSAALPFRCRPASLRIGIIGDGVRMLRHYPAVMLSLGDAAARAGSAVMPVFVPAPTMLHDGLPAGLDGLVLPGGPDMGQVEAQVEAADAAFAIDLPLLGLCLGMQSMATAAMRRGGATGAMPEEVAGPGAERSFTLMRDATGSVRHRLGDTALAPLAGSRLAALASGGTKVRMHHRYALNASLTAALTAGGLVVSAYSDDGIAEATEAPGKCFHLGLQGHPELGVDAGLAGIWDGFVAAVQRRRAERTPGRTDEATISP